MISVSLFLIVVLSGIGALVNANLLGHKSQNTRSIIDSLSFIMEDISKNLRTGEKYHCVDDDDYININSKKNCVLGGKGIAFLDTFGDKWIYKIESTRKDNEGKSIYDISKSTDGGVTFAQLNPNEVILESDSIFIVRGENEQPSVTIRLVGKIIYKDVATPFSLQTSISQRFIDLE